MITMEKVNSFFERKELPILIKEDKKFYMCDYCRMAIAIKKKIGEQDGGEVVLPATLLGRGKAKIAAHNKCLNPMIKEIEQLRKLV